MRAPLFTFLIFIAACDSAPDPRRTNFRVERDNVVARYDEKTGRLSGLEVDTNKDGKADTWTFADGTRTERIEIDRDRDGIVDRWEYYGPDNLITKVGSSARGDGIADEWAFQRADGSLERVETDADRDGNIDKWESFDAPPTAGGAAILRSVALDTQRTGRPTERLLYRTDGSLERVEKLSAPAARNP
jgi:hypothetical protein